MLNRKQFYNPKLRRQMDQQATVLFWRSRARRKATPLEAAHVANVTIRERFDHDHFRRVMDARNFLVGE